MSFAQSGLASFIASRLTACSVSSFRPDRGRLGFWEEERSWGSPVMTLGLMPLSAGAFNRA